MESLSDKMMSGFTWTAIERVFSQLVVFVIGIIIARLITPDEYGILGILMVFVNVASVFIDSGLGSALIYYNELKEKDLRTTFTTNLLISVLLSMLIIVSSPFVERFYELPNLSLYLNVISIVIIANAFIVVPTAILKVKLDFKSLAITNILSSVISGITAIILAYQSFGIWALIIQVLLRALLQVLFLLSFCRWIPRLSVCKESLKKLYKYAINIFTASWITKLTEEGISFFLGKSFNAYSLGIYTRATQFSTLPSTSLGAVIISVLFPSLALVKDDEQRFQSMYNRTIRVTAMLTVPVFVLLAVVSEPLIRIVLTDKWIEAAPILSVLCLGRILFPVSNITEQALNAKGYSDLFFKQQLVKMIVKAALIVPALFINIMAVAVADALSSLAAYVITTVIARKNLHIKVFEQIKCLGDFVFASMATGALSFISLRFFDNLFIQIIIPVLIYLVLYMIYLVSYSKEDIIYILNRIRGIK